MRRGREESVQYTHSRECMKVGSDRTANEEAEADELGPEEDGKTSVALDEHDGNDPSGAETEDGPVGGEIVDLVGRLYEENEI